VKKYLFLACHHDRHTDDEYKLFVDERKAKTQCHEWLSYSKDVIVQNHQYGDWCLFIDESYYAFVQKVEVIE
jgi:hypothetical protein